MIKLPSGREIELRPYTRSIARAMNEELLRDVIVQSSGDGETAKETTAIPAINADRAEEMAIRLLTGLSQEDLDNLSNEDYLALKRELNSITKGKKKE